MDTLKYKIEQFISEPIEVEFLFPPNFYKKPRCPHQIIHRTERFQIVECIAE